MNILFWALAIVGALCVGTTVALLVFLILSEFLERRREATLSNPRLVAAMSVTLGDEDDYVQWLEKTYWRKETT